jgi:hypothetical protein
MPSGPMTPNSQPGALAVVRHDGFSHRRVEQMRTYGVTAILHATDGDTRVESARNRSMSGVTHMSRHRKTSYFDSVRIPPSNLRCDHGSEVRLEASQQPIGTYDYFRYPVCTVASW